MTRQSGSTVTSRRRWRRRVASLPILVAVAVGATVVDPPQTSAATLVWSDEFTGTGGTSPAASRWNWETGGGGWGNNEWQTYTNSRVNSRLDGNGRLAIVGRLDNGFVTSARMNTLGKFSFTYGTVSARIKLPAGKGLLPAFWLMGTDIYSVGWPRSGEVDVIETPSVTTSYTNHLHGPTTSGGHWQLGNGGAIADLSTDYHVYSVTKSRNAITISLDGRTVGTYRAGQLRSGQQWVFNKPTYVLFSLAIGGNWPGAPDLTTPNPSYMLTDWIRAYSA
ncbi:glycoside hydrolase family 16 protein [Gordonia insulae]|uniref:Beta-glucanase n=1 Tax=Gordonia insulae TaxID=2420509 RepID=A0A3G8JJQ9_9ACTN|nr:glycoside hydrolase family 16 protein [Gordonia insulae]AZG44450.1 Beta-glucanase [Gordonia insulae]